MQKLAIWAFLGFLGYICVMLTSINSKIDTMYTSGMQYTVLNEVRPQSYTASNIQEVAFKRSDWTQPPASLSVHAGFLVAAMIAIFVSWHLSRIYYAHHWTKTILRKTFTHYSAPFLTPTPSEPLHVDQDCTEDAPHPDGRIKDSWLPPHAKELYKVWRQA